MARYELRLSEDGEDEVGAIRLATARATRGDVIRDALAVYGELVKRAQRGDHLFLGRTLESSVELDITTLRKAREG